MYDVQSNSQLRRHVKCFLIEHFPSNRGLTDKPNQNRNRIESESGKESKGDINTSVVVIGHFCYGDWGSKLNSIA